MEKPKAGLHKKISSIFDGVPVPKITDNQQSSPPVGPDYKGYIPPRPQAPMPTPRREMPARMPKKSVFRQPDIFAKTSKRSIFEDIAGKISGLKLGQFADKQKIKILIPPILAIILALVLYRNFTGSSKFAPRRPVTENLKTGTGVAQSASLIVWQKPELYPVFMRDPTQMSAAGAYSAGGGAGVIAVRGIVYSDDEPSAVIGSEIKHEGDTVGEATVVKINHDSVEFSMNGKTWTQKVQ